RMITSFDDYPIHQTSLPVAHPGTGDRNYYDRYFFNGYDRDGDFFFAVAMGLYPNRKVIDASFSVVHAGEQRSVHASARAPLDRSRTAVGPVRVEVIEPLRRLRVVVDAPEHGLSADLAFIARTPAVEEPRTTMASGVHVTGDYTRLTQWGAWEGTLSAGGTGLTCTPARVPGTRDRSWGIRGVGEAPGGAPPAEMPAFFWLWAPLHFDDHCTHYALIDDARGRHTYESACRVPLLPAADELTEIDHARNCDFTIDWAPGTRRARAAELTTAGWDGGRSRVALTPLLTFQMRGLGYFHPEWSHGVWKGENAVGGECWKLGELDPAAPENTHVQLLVRARTPDGPGIGVLEQLHIGPHAPSGFTGLFDPASETR
ncbi:MAG: hypothetical protein FWE15_22915, partial [Actinomycetia bacterium]|nr:hypothetical protein [Actinomycetes bacterium]